MHSNIDYEDDLQKQNQIVTHNLSAQKNKEGDKFWHNKHVNSDIPYDLT